MLWSGHSVHTFTSRQSAYLESWLRILPWMVARLKSSPWMWLDLESPRRHTVVRFPGSISWGKKTHTGCGWLHFTGWVFDWIKKRKGESQMSTSIHIPAFWLAQESAASCRCNCSCRLLLPSCPPPPGWAASSEPQDRLSPSHVGFFLPGIWSWQQDKCLRQQLLSFPNDNCFNLLRCPKAILISFSL